MRLPKLNQKRPHRRGTSKEFEQGEGGIGHGRDQKGKKVGLYKNTPLGRKRGTGWGLRDRPMPWFDLKKGNEVTPENYYRKSRKRNEGKPGKRGGRGREADRGQNKEECRKKLRASIRLGEFFFKKILLHDYPLFPSGWEQGGGNRGVREEAEGSPRALEPFRSLGRRLTIKKKQQMQTATTGDLFRRARKILTGSKYWLPQKKGDFKEPGDPGKTKPHLNETRQ